MGLEVEVTDASDLRAYPGREALFFAFVSQHVGAATRTMTRTRWTLETPATQTGPMRQPIEQTANMAACDGPVFAFCILANRAYSGPDEHLSLDVCHFRQVANFPVQARKGLSGALFAVTWTTLSYLYSMPMS